MEKLTLQCVIEEEILFTNKKIFKSNEEYSYTCKCYDGVAICTPTPDDEEEDDVNLPMIIATYPKRKDVLLDSELCRSILDYRGLYDVRKNQITFGDIMLKLGKLTKVKDSEIELALQLFSANI